MDNSAYKYEKDYFGIDNLALNIILAVIAGPILGVIVRFMQGRNIAAVIRLVICLTNVFVIVPYIFDIIWIAKYGKICDLGGLDK